MKNLHQTIEESTQNGLRLLVTSRIYTRWLKNPQKLGVQKNKVFFAFGDSLQPTEVLEQEFRNPVFYTFPLLENTRILIQMKNPRKTTTDLLLSLFSPFWRRYEAYLQWPDQN